MGYGRFSSSARENARSFIVGGRPYVCDWVVSFLSLFPRVFRAFSRFTLGCLSSRVGVGGPPNRGSRSIPTRAHSPVQLLILHASYDLTMLKQP